MKPEIWNNNFDAIEHLTLGQREYLLALNRVACTEVRFTKEQALSAIGLPALDSDWESTPDSRLTFSGTIITNSPMVTGEYVNTIEADQIAISRGFGETITGILCSVHPVDDIAGGGLNPLIG